MPFTFSHPAIVIPLSKLPVGLSLTALVAGSMVPDFEFIFRMKVGANIGHHWLGLPVFDLPVALLLCFVFHQYVRNDLILHLPAWYRVRFSPFMDFDWNTYARANKLRVIASVIIGILSHFFWDAFTHYDGLFVTLLPVLQRDIPLFQLRIPVYSMLQVVSSVWGLWLVHSEIADLPVSNETASVPSSSYWATVTTGALLILLVRLLTQPQDNSVWSLLFAGMGSVIYALIGVSIIRRTWQRTTWWER